MIVTVTIKPTKNATNRFTSNSSKARDDIENFLLSENYDVIEKSRVGPIPSNTTNTNLIQVKLKFKSETDYSEFKKNLEIFLKDSSIKSYLDVNSIQE